MEHKGEGFSPLTGKKEATSAGKFWGWNTIHDKAGNGAPYMTRIWIGRLRFHIFYRGDLDEDCHDHPWDFWTFPLTSYVEEVAEIYACKGDYWFVDGVRQKLTTHLYKKNRQIVPAFRLTFRPAEHCHRVLAAWSGKVMDDFGFSHRVRAKKANEILGDRFQPQLDFHKRIVTIVWRSKPKRTWGFLKNRDGKWCWVVWKDYVFGTGKSAPCE